MGSPIKLRIKFHNKANNEIFYFIIPLETKLIFSAQGLI